tara:strand:+ start:873 stop:1028 length:156 start_codon:yes stop_codon:yes gene_type:complete
MMKKKLIYCDSCEAEFKINHDMDEEYYQVKFCPFCGSEIDEEYEDDIDEYE